MPYGVQVISRVLYVLGKEGRRAYWATGEPTGEYSNHDGSNEHKSRELGEFSLTMLYVHPHD